MVIIAIFSFVVAVLLTRLVGHQSDGAWRHESGVEACYSGQCPLDMVEDEVQQWFGTVYRSMYTLFMIMTLANWPLVVDVVAKQFPAIEWIVLVYISITTYTLLSIVTATLSERMIAAVQTDSDRRRDEMESDRQRFITEMGELFEECDQLSEDGLVTEEEFASVLYDEEKGVLKHLAALGIAGQEGQLDVTEDELMRLFKLVMKETDDGQHGVDIDGFVAGFTRLKGAAKSSDLLTTEMECKSIFKKVSRMETDVKEFQHDMKQVRQDVKEMLHLLKRETGRDSSFSGRKSTSQEARSSRLVEI